MKNDVNVSDYIGQKFGHLTVNGEAPKTHDYSNRFLLRCDCGSVISEQPGRIIGGHKQTCGRKCKICRKMQSRPGNFSDCIGAKSGNLTVIGVEKEKISETREQTVLKCVCSCGNTINVLPYQFRNGVVKSCGRCRTIAGVRDGRSVENPGLYSVWQQMIARCENKNHKWYHRYGGRGITVCDEWQNYRNFEKWVNSTGGRPVGHSLDRINNDGPYSPENCRWSTQKEQTRNQSRTIIIEFNGKSQSLADWADELGIKWVTLHNRYVRDWSVERMLTEPVKKKPRTTEG